MALTVRLLGRPAIERGGRTGRRGARGATRADRRARRHARAERARRGPPGALGDAGALAAARLLAEAIENPRLHAELHTAGHTMVEIEGEAMRQVTWCVVEEVKSGDWAIGGNCLTTAGVHALAAS